MSANRSRLYAPMTRWKQARWLLLYAAMISADAAVVVTVIDGA